MTQEVIEELTKLYLKEIDKEQDKFVMTKKDLIKFSMKLLKLIKRCDNG